MAEPKTFVVVLNEIGAATLSPKNIDAFSNLPAIDTNTDAYLAAA